jgi:hypothetical protein
MQKYKKTFVPENIKSGYMVTKHDKNRRTLRHNFQFFMKQNALLCHYYKRRI